MNGIKILMCFLLLPVIGCAGKPQEQKPEINKLEAARQLWGRAYDKMDSSINGYIPTKEANEQAQPFIDKADSIALYLSEPELEKLKEYKVMRMNRAVDYKLEQNNKK